MSFDEKTVWTIQKKTQFNTDNIEKVLRLLEILNKIFAASKSNLFTLCIAIILFYCARKRWRVSGPGIPCG